MMGAYQILVDLIIRKPPGIGWPLYSVVFRTKYEILAVVAHRLLSDSRDGGTSRLFLFYPLWHGDTNA
ncbi:hypothetical protein P4H61_14675, partial [Paenibacillus peoriae]|uniref:hypothetical protein n=1 Tax=Paenibacillus peoriae TaxID=59893 RepID=UPI002DB89D7D